jgi:hypothetical protein
MIPGPYSIEEAYAVRAELAGPIEPEEAPESSG